MSLISLFTIGRTQRSLSSRAFFGICVHIYFDVSIFFGKPPYVFAHYHFLLTFIIFNFMILMVIVTRKKVIIGTILLLVGAMVMVCGIIGAGAGDVVEETYNSDLEYGLSIAEKTYESLLKGEYNKKDPAPLIDPVIILGVVVSLVGVVFLVKSKDKDFLPGI